ncbi:hypothetical protein KY285_000299 [Solanum tuberosum]|nr:hypothetical protein KY285_000299 [Solanum tuberosum]
MTALLRKLAKAAPVAFRGDSKSNFADPRFPFGAIAAVAGCVSYYYCHSSANWDSFRCGVLPILFMPNCCVRSFPVFADSYLRDDLILLFIYVIGRLSSFVTINTIIALVRGKITMYDVWIRCVSRVRTLQLTKG